MTKTVLVELSLMTLVDVPDDWNQDNIEFYLNESCHCLGNELQELAASDAYVMQRNSCDTCHRSRATYVREATADDKQCFRLRHKPNCPATDAESQGPTPPPRA